MRLRSGAVAACAAAVRGVRHSAVVRGSGAVAHAAAVVAVSAVSAAVVAGSVGRAVAAVVSSAVRGVVVVSAVGSGGGVVVRSAVTVMRRCRCYVVVMRSGSSVVVRTVCIVVVVSQVRVVVCAVVACGVRGSYPRSVNGHCPSEPDVHHRGVESKQLCHRNGVAAVVYPNVVEVHRCRNHLVGADVVTVNPHLVAKSRHLFPHIRGVNVVHVVGIVGVVDKYFGVGVEEFHYAVGLYACKVLYRGFGYRESRCRNKNRYYCG